MSAIDKEMAALYCDNDYCDCNNYGEVHEAMLSEWLTGETTSKLAEMGVTVTWTREHPVLCHLTID
jgi:hypothetical protein